MRLPDPIANTTTEAYLAYKAGVLEVGDLKPSLYDPYLHFDAWLAYWCGLTNTYPSKGEGDNLYNVYDYKTGSGGVKPDKSGYITLSYDNSAGASNAYMTYFTNNLDLETSTEYAIVMEVKQVSGSGTMYIASSNQATGTYSQFSLNNTISFSDLSDGDVIVVKNTTRSEFTLPGAGTRSYARFAAGEKGSITLRLSVLADTSVTPSSFSYEPHFIPEMLTDEEALVAYLSGVTNTYPEEIKDPYDVRIVGYLKYLVSVKYGRPEYPVNNEEFYLSMLMPPSVSNDTPASSITLQGTAKYPFLDLLMYGDCAQQTYTGKNLFNNQSVEIGKNYNGAVGTVAYPFNNQSNRAAVLIPIEASTTYNFSMTDGSLYLMEVRECDVDYTVTKSISSPNSNNVDFNFTSQSTGKYLVAKFKYGSAGTENITQAMVDALTLQLEKGSTATSYEPYVGGIPAPNPDYPQEVHMVTGKQTVKVTGKNLFNCQETPAILSGGVTTTTTEDSIKLAVSDLSSTTKFAAWAVMPLSGMEGKTVTLSVGDIEVVDVYRSIWRMALCDADGGNRVALGTYYDANSSFSHTITSEETTRWLGVQLYAYSNSSQSQVGGYIKYSNLQLEVSASATPYEPYESKSTVAPLTGKNMFSFDAWDFVQKSTTSLTVSSITGSSITLEATGATGAQYYSVKSNIDGAKTYTFSCKAKKLVGGSDGQPRLIFKYRTSSDGGQTWSSTVTLAQVTTPTIGEEYTLSGELTLDASNNAIMFLFYNNGGTPVTVGEKTTYYDIQFEEGSTPTSFIPYHAPIELCKIGDYQDYIYKNQDGDWYLHKETGKVTLTGANTEDWRYNSNNSVFLIADYIMYKPDGTAPYSNYFVGKSNISSYSLLNNNEIALLKSNADNRLIVKFLDAGGNVTNLRTWLSSHNTTVCYPLATATDALITYPDVVDALNEILAGGSYKDTTYIEVTADDDNLPGLLTVTAGKE